MKVRGTLAGLYHCDIDLETRKEHEIYDEISNYVDAVSSVEFSAEVFEEDVAADADDGGHGVEHFESVVEENKDYVFDCGDICSDS